METMNGLGGKKLFQHFSLTGEREKLFELQKKKLHVWGLLSNVVIKEWVHNLFQTLAHFLVLIMVDSERTRGILKEPMFTLKNTAQKDVDTEEQ